MSLALLAKVVGMSTAVSTTLGSFVYYSARETKFKEHLQKIESKDEKIKELESENAMLSKGLEISRNPIHVRVVCNPGDLPIEKELSWSSGSFELSCDPVKPVK